MFEMTKIAGALLMPLTLVFLAAAGGLALLFTRRWRWGRGLLIGALAALFFFSWTPTARLLIAPLESHYPPLLEPAALDEEIGYVVVLGGGHRADPSLPVTAQLNPSATIRMLEGVRIHRALPESTLIFSGGSVFQPVANAEVMRRVAEAVGVDTSRVVLHDTPRNTVEEARAVQRRVEAAGGGRVVLVTSASHMPRAVALFRGQGLDPIPAPTQHRVRESAGEGFLFGGWRPSANALRISELAWHEYLGLAWARLRGWTGAPEE